MSTGANPSTKRGIRMADSRKISEAAQKEICSQTACRNCQAGGLNPGEPVKIEHGAGADDRNHCGNVDELVAEHIGAVGQCQAEGDLSKGQVAHQRQQADRHPAEHGADNDAAGKGPAEGDQRLVDLQACFGLSACAAGSRRSRWRRRRSAGFRLQRSGQAVLARRYPGKMATTATGSVVATMAPSSRQAIRPISGSENRRASG